MASAESRAPSPCPNSEETSGLRPSATGSPIWRKRCCAASAAGSIGFRALVKTLPCPTTWRTSAEALRCCLGSRGGPAPRHRCELSCRRKEDYRFRVRYRVPDGYADETSGTIRRKEGTRTQGGREEEGGRPFIGRVARVHISLTVTPQTQAALKREARRRGLSIGLLVDDLTSSFRKRGA